MTNGQLQLSCRIIEVKKTPWTPLFFPFSKQLLKSINHKCKMADSDISFETENHCQREFISTLIYKKIKNMNKSFRAFNYSGIMSRKLEFVTTLCFD